MTPTAPAPPPRVDFWYEIASTYTYLASTRIDRLAAEAGVDVTWRPFVLGPIFAARGWSTSPFDVYPDKGRYMWRDMERTADALGVPFRKPSVFPRNTILAARVALVGAERGWGAAFGRGALRANFAEDRDVSAAAVLDEILGALGVDGPGAREESTSPAFRPKLREATTRATDLGIFGAPSFVTRGELFWGNDRLEQALAWATDGAA